MAVPQLCPRAVLFGLLVAGACEGAGDVSPIPADPGHVALRRLSRAGYDNTVRDLLGTAQQPGRTFPVEAPTAGFDDLAGANGVSELEMALYERTAWSLAQEVVAHDATNDAPARVMVCDPAQIGEPACMRTIARTFVPRAWRRPVDDEELAPLIGLLEGTQAAGGRFDDAVEAMVATTLMAPDFIFRAERAGPGTTRLAAHELATRLSYFAWSSMPDAQLTTAAAAGALDDAAGIEVELDRMLDDPRARALADDFAGQWLGIRALDDVFKDQHTFPTWDPALRDALAEQMRRDFMALVDDDAPLEALLLSTHTSVDARIAAHYGVADGPSEADGVVIQDLARVGRMGWLTQAGWLAAQSHPFTTSPTRRGRWVLEALWCMQLPDPPPDVDAAPVHGDGTKRELLAAQRHDPSCASCHAWTDPIGLALEPWDATGRWRLTDGGATIETAGVLPDGRSFADVYGLAQMLVDDPAFERCVVRQTMTWATGRPMTNDDSPWIEEIVDELDARGGGLRTLLLLVASSEPMRWQGPPRGGV